MKPIPNIELHIEELILHDFPHGDRYQIAEAVERELTRLFAEQGIPASLTHGGEIARLHGGSFTVAQGSQAAAIGAQVAQSVYGGMNA
jgi:hypothetical protein